jgi:hypothetical protein
VKPVWIVACSFRGGPWVPERMWFTRKRALMDVRYLSERQGPYRYKAVRYVPAKKEAKP